MILKAGEMVLWGSGLKPANIDFNSLALDPQPATEPGKSKGTAAALETKEANSFAVKGINLEGDEQKALYWKSQERRRLSWYAKWTKAAASQFKKESKGVAAAYENGGKKAALKEITSKDNQKEWAAQYLRHYKGIVKEFGESAFNNLKSAGPSERKDGELLSSIGFDPYDEIIQEYLVTAAAEKVTGVLEFTKQVIASIIVDMEKEGANVDNIARAIRKEYDDMSINRAFRIARTETDAASNYGLYQAGIQSGVAVKKGWINSADDRVRDNHDFKE